MYVNITGSKDNKDIYLYHSFRMKTEGLHHVSIKNLANIIH